MVFRCSGGDTFTIARTGGIVTTRITGGEADTIKVQTIDAATTVNAGADVDTVNVGSLEPAIGGTVNAINALLTINGNDGADTLNVDDTGDSLANTGTLTSTTLTSLGMASGIVYGTLESVNVNLGSGGDAFTIASTHAGTTTLNPNAGFDMVHLPPIAGATPVTTGSGSDTINVGSLEPAIGGNVNAINALLTIN